MEYKPSDKIRYDNYIQNLKTNLITRLEAYSDSKLANIKSEEEFKNVLSNENAIYPKKIKIGNYIYLRSDISNNHDLNIKYKNTINLMLSFKLREELGKTYPDGFPKILRYNIRITNTRDIKITDVWLARSNYSNGMTFDEGMQIILNS